MIQEDRKLFKEQEDETGVDAAVARGQGQIPLEKIEAFKNTLARMYDTTTKAPGTGGSMPSSAAKPAKSSGQTGQPSATGGPDETEKKGSAPKSQDLSDEQQVRQSVSEPQTTQGFVELEKDASDQALDILSTKLNVDKDSIKKLTMTRGVRVLLDPNYLKIK